MPDRIVSVTAHTTLDFVDATVEGHDFGEDAPAVVDATTPRDDPEHVELQVELDNTELSDIRPHATTVVLSPDQARRLADDLVAAADEVEAARD